ncbi:MAG TPA: hypothetical protein PLN69_12595, partial [bacterium]|nr:hypothetical protein [bacterium]
PSGRIEDLDRLLKNVAFSFQINDLDDIYEEIGYGKLEMSLVLDVFRKRYTQIIEVEDWEADASITKDPIFQRPIETSLIKCEKQLKARLFLGELCAPLPGDDIEVSVTGKRMVVHRAGCPHRSRYFLRGRKYPATWGKTNGRLFPARIKLKIFPTKTIFQKTLELFEKNKIEVIASRTGIQSDEGLELIEFIIGVKNTEDLNNIKEELLKLRDVVAFRRI